jgi:hypothetical protein
VEYYELQKEMMEDLYEQYINAEAHFAFGKVS